MDPLADLEARGLVPDSTDREALRARIRAGQIGVYYGADPSSDSPQIGNPLADVITKVLYTYTIRILRQESSLRDHDAAASSSRRWCSHHRRARAAEAATARQWSVKPWWPAAAASVTIA